MSSQGSLSQKRIQKAIAKSLSQMKYKRNESLIGKRSSASTVKGRIAKNKVEGVIRGVPTAGPEGPERKKQDMLVAFTNVSATTAYVTSLYNNIAQGTQSNQRVGDRVTIKAVDFEANCKMNQTTGTAFMDVFLVWDKEPAGTITTAGTIFSTNATNLTYTNVATTDRFVILRREQLCFDTSNLSKSIKWHVPCDVGIKWSDAAGYPQSNDFLICALCPGTSGAAGSCDLSYIARSSYIDA